MLWSPGGEDARHIQGDMVREDESAGGQMISKMGRQSVRDAAQSLACKNACFLEPNSLALCQGNGAWEVIQTTVWQ